MRVCERLTGSLEMEPSALVSGEPNRAAPELLLLPVESTQPQELAAKAVHSKINNFFENDSVSYTHLTLPTTPYV